MRRGMQREASAIGLGVEFRPGGIYMALIRQGPATVIGLGASRYPAATVMTADMRRPRIAGDALRALVDRIHWNAAPVVAVAVEPTSPAATPSIVQTPATSPRVGNAPAGSVWAAARRVDATVELMQQAGLPVDVVDSTATAVIRFVENASPAEPVIFARGGTGGRRWTACSSVLGLEVETQAGLGDPVKLLVGGDLSSLRPPCWGELATSSRIRKSHAAPGYFTPAVGAALAAIGEAPHVNLIGAEARRSHSGEPSELVIERVGR